VSWNCNDTELWDTSPHYYVDQVANVLRECGVEIRSYPFQKYFESGFPYGHDQWISAATSSWATMALILTVEAPVDLTGNGAR
jgi:hypothetical protein